MAANKKPEGIEWVGGLVSMPAYITGEGEPYRPEALFWMGPEGALLGHTLGKPGELVDQVCESLRNTIAAPTFGRPHTPARVRVSSPDLAQALRQGQSEIEVVCAPTPELDAVLTAMRESLDGDLESEQSYLSDDVGPEAIGAFFRAAAGLFRAKPWKTVPSDQNLFSLTIEKLGVTDAALSVIGQMGESLGLILFSGLDDFEAYLEGAEAVQRGEEPPMPPHFAINFERGAELSTSLRKEIAEYRWEVAGAPAYPWLMAVDEDLVPRPPTAEEVTFAEAVALALPTVLKEKKQLLAAWNGGEPVARTLLVSTYAGELEVTLRAPYMRAPVVFDASHDILADLAALSRRDDEVDYNAREALEEELVKRFAASPEAKDLDEIHACRFVMDLAANYLGETVAMLGATGLREVLFTLIPRKVSIEASEANWMITELRAFYAFLKREFSLKQADSCLKLLDSAAVKKLEAALSDSSNFGMAKSLFAAGADAGFDMQSQQGIDAWMRSIQGKPLPASIPLPGLPKPSKQAAKAKKDARNAASKARRKNR